MNPQSPGLAPDEEDDIEMASMDDVVQRSSPLQNGTKHAPYNQVKTGDHSDSEDDELDIDDEGSRALLGAHERTRGWERLPLRQVGRLWPQVQSIVVESAPTLLLTTIGLLFTGKLLDQVSRWKAMREVDQLIMIIPVVLNLKGNLEMNLSARLGTAANVGELDDPPTRRSMIIGNMTLLQVQAAVVSFVAACVALVLGIIVPRLPQPTEAVSPSSDTATRFVLHHLLSTTPRRPPLKLPPPSDGPRRSGLPTFIMITSTAMSAACLSSMILGSFMCTLIVLCRHFGRDPDNIAPPVASCLGDLITLCLVGLVSTLLIYVINTPIPFLVAVSVVILAVTCLVYTLRNPHVRGLLTQGWTPLFGAMVISSATGIVLDLFVSRYEGFALLAVVISGLPGSVGSIFVSRLSTSLHAAALSLSTVASYLRPGSTEPSPRVVMLTLLVVTLPVEIIFLAVLRGLGWLQLPFLFISLSVIFFCVAVLISLVIAQYLTEYLWSKEYDPDMYALPIHSALMDLVGQILLVICFEIVSLMGGHVELKKL